MKRVFHSWRPKVAALPFVALALPLAAQAQDFAGAEIDFGYTAYVDDTSLEKISLGASAEFDVTTAFSVQGDLLFSRFGAADITGNNGTLHGIFDLTPNNTVGVFLGRDVIDDIRTNLGGIEGHHVLGRFAVEWYAGELFGSDVDALLLGLDTWYQYSPALEFGAHYDRANFNAADTDFSTFTLSANYRVSDRAVAYAEYGSSMLSMDGLSGGEDIFSFGVRIGFGRNRGTTMGYRGLDAILPGL